MRRILAFLLSLAFLFPLLPIGAALAAEPQTPSAVQGDILTYYEAHGGESMFGAPISGEMTEAGHTVQYFTRARLEVWPDNPPAYRVMPGLLGVQMGKVEPAIDPATAPVNDPDRRYFPETGHVVAFAFKTFWENNGGIDLLGYPTTELLVEGGVTVQYFQRARLEWHPEIASGSQVTLGDLGLEYLRSTGVAVPSATSSSTAAPAATYDGQGHILFALSPGGDFYSVRPDGSELRMLGQGIDPTQSPDGKQIAYASWYPPGIFVQDQDGQNLHLIKMTSYPWQPLKPLAASWSPDGKFIAFTEQYRDWRPVRYGRVSVNVLMDLWRIDVLNVETGQVHVIVQDDNGVQPTWGPDGRMMFASTQGLFVVNTIEGLREITKVANTTPLFDSPSWSPDGQWIAFQWKQHDHQEIGTMNFDGSGFRLLTSSPIFTTPANNVTPAVSPDGKQIAFVSDRSGKWELYVMNADGSDQHKVDLGGLSLDYQNVHERILSWGK